MDIKRERLNRIRKCRMEKNVKGNEKRPPFKPAGSAKLEKYEVLKPPPFKPLKNCTRENNHCSSRYGASNEREQHFLSQEMKNGNSKEMCRKTEFNKAKSIKSQATTFAPTDFVFKGIQNKYSAKYNFPNVTTKDKCGTNMSNCPFKNSGYNTPRRNIAAKAKKFSAYEDCSEKNIGNKQNFNQTYLKGCQNKNIDTLLKSSSKPGISNTTILSPFRILNDNVKTSSSNDGSSFITMRVKTKTDKYKNISEDFNKTAARSKKELNDKNFNFCLLNQLNGSPTKVHDERNMLPKNMNVNSYTKSSLSDATNRHSLHNSLNKPRYSKLNESLNRSFSLTETTKKTKQALFSGSDFENSMDELFVTCLASPRSSTFDSVNELTFTKSPETFDLKNSFAQLNITYDIDNENSV